MLSWFRQLDALLRGQSTEPHLLQRGAAELALRRFVMISLVLGGVYGFFMGWYAITTRATPNPMQLVASTLKLPLLFLLTLIVTFPSLYVFSALTGCRLGFGAVLRLLVGTITVNLAVAASMAPILGFFTLSTESYPFMIILNVALLGVSGAVALGFLLNVLRRLARASAPSYMVPDPPDPASPEPTSPPAGARPLFAQGARTREEGGHGVFHIWVIIYGLVGAQMGWLLRPFIGHPNMPFEWFRPRSGNFFQSVWTQLQHLFG